MDLYGSLWGLLPGLTPLLLAVALVASSVGFLRTVYFISAGYGFSVAAMALTALLVLGRRTDDPLAWIQATLLAAYGLRLALYVLGRDRKASYRTLSRGEGRQEVGPFLRPVIWFGVSLLYLAMFTPALARFAASAAGAGDRCPAVSIAGIAVMACGLAVEGIADRQKSAFKAVHPERFCDTGLFRLVRCPNYFGELLVWTGSLAGGATMISSWPVWVLAIGGYLCIVLIMIGSTRRLELSQERRYGNDPEYRKYAARVPVLLPLIPLYSVRNAPFYLG